MNHVTRRRSRASWSMSESSRREGQTNINESISVLRKIADLFCADHGIVSEGQHAAFRSFHPATTPHYHSSRRSSSDVGPRQSSHRPSLPRAAKQRSGRWIAPTELHVPRRLPRAPRLDRTGRITRPRNLPHQPRLDGSSLAAPGLLLGRLPWRPVRESAAGSLLAGTTRCETD